MSLTLTPNIDDPDAFYTSLLKAHDGFDTEQSSKLDARLILVLANHIGDSAVLDEALKLARETA